MDLEGKVVTAYALLTQVKIANYIDEERKADYVFKDNQPTLKSHIETLNLKEKPCDHKTVDKGHGRIEIRKIHCSTQQNDLIEFPHVAQVFCIEREVFRVKKEKTTTEVVYGITSQSPDKASPE